jgi:hypothetical protein
MSEIKEQRTTEDRLQSIEKKLDLLNLICVKNGGGRHVNYNRSEFFQMLYDRHSLIKISENFYKYAIVILVILQIAEFFIKNK